jgi:hypothetical protein
MASESEDLLYAEWVGRLAMNLALARHCLRRKDARSAKVVLDSLYRDFMHASPVPCEELKRTIREAV